MKQYLLSFIVVFAIGYTQAQTPTLWGLTYGGGTNSAGTIFSFNTGTNQPVASYSFFASDSDGVRPNGTLLEATDGYFYGTTMDGGKNTEGSMFRYDVTSGVEKVVHSFTDINGDGGDPGYALIQVNDSLLYGVTDEGGSNAQGTIFSFNILSGQETVDYSFGGDTDATSPVGPLFQLNDSLLYGLSIGGGSKFYGAIYEYNIHTQEENVVHSFGNDTDGRYCNGALIKANDGLLYGLTYAGGKNNAGTIFNFDPGTGVETHLHSFGGGFNGVSPYSTFIPVGDSDLYSVTYEGGNHSVGTIFKYNIYSKVTTQLYEFGSGTDGEYPYYGPLFQSGNLLYGMTQMGGANEGGMIFTYDLTLGTENDVYDFNTGKFGEEPQGGFVVYNTVTAVKQLAANSNQFSLYPNPSSDFIYTNIQLKQPENLQLLLVNMLGQTVWSADAGTISSYQNGISVANLPGGVYLLEMVTGGGTETREVIVTH